MDAGPLLAPLTGAPERSAILLDVDGTLAPIVARPELSEVPPKTKAELRRLVAEVPARRLCERPLERRRGPARWSRGHPRSSETTGSSSTRARPSSRRRFDSSFPRLEIPDGIRRGGQGALRHPPLPRGGGPGKGAALARPRSQQQHFRTGSTRAGAAWCSRFALRSAADKGTAVRALIAESGATRALYAGDDVTDLDAFAALERGELESTVRVAVASSEGPSELAERADLVVESPEALTDLLGLL